LNDQEKEQITKEAKFNVAKKSFYAPEEAQEFKIKAEQSALSGQAPASDAPGRAPSAMSSIDKGSKDGDKSQKADTGPPYTALVPE